MLIDYHSQRLCHRVVHSLRNPIPMGVIGGNGHFPNIHQLVYHATEFGSVHRAIVGEEMFGASVFYHALTYQRVRAVPPAVNSVFLAEYVDARRLKRPLKSEMLMFSLLIFGRGPKL